MRDDIILSLAEGELWKNLCSSLGYSQRLHLIVRVINQSFTYWLEDGTVLKVQVNLRKQVSIKDFNVSRGAIYNSNT